MKVKNIETHSLKHIWLAYVKKLLKEHPEYRRKDEGKVSHYNDIVIKRNVRDKWVQVIDYNQFRKIAEHLLNNAKNAIIQGELFQFPHCGKVFVKRIQRDFRSKRRQVDWAKSIKKNTDFDANGKRIFKKLVFFSNDDYLRVVWLKQDMTNKRWYEFMPASGDCKRQAGFKLELSKANVKDPILKYRYLFSPLKDIIKQVV